MNRFFCFTVFSFVLSFFYNPSVYSSPKREFRGVWLQTVNREEYKKMTPAEMRGYFTYMLDEFQKAGFNAVVFQVRPKADAFYDSSYEPWSEQLTGMQGRAPSPYWDPMEYLIRECHKRNMEFHAWLNPYRVTSRKGEKLASSHVYYKHPEWFVTYNGNIYFDPGIPACREYICKIVKDIVSRYDVDAIHMDDYFYPYPVKGQAFPDDNSFKKYGKKQGYYPNRKSDWRRNNVNMLILEIKETIVDTKKPWVKFGISPFGIYRNKRSTPDGSGSDTNGLQNYDDLYADVLLWSRNEWIDYLVPQLYWEIGHRLADYETLTRWWGLNVKHGHLYIGQDIDKCVPRTETANVNRKQIARKMTLGRVTPSISGNCFWYGYAILDNMGGILDSLKNNYHRFPAMIPPSTHLPDNKRPKEPQAPQSLEIISSAKGNKLVWTPKKEKDKLSEATYYCVYRFHQHQKEDFNNPENIVRITRDTEYLLPYVNGKTVYKYVVTSVNRLHYESRTGKKILIRL